MTDQPTTARPVAERPPTDQAPPGYRRFGQPAHPAPRPLRAEGRLRARLRRTGAPITGLLAGRLIARLPHRGAGSSHGGALRRLTVSTTAGGMMLVGTPVMLDYVVRPGDTLSEIAAEHGTSVTRIVERNDLHSSGDQVYAGQTLDLRSGGGSGGGSNSGGISPDARRIVSYTVRPGDTPSGLAVRFHAWTAELIARNGSVLRVGERIEIPVVLAAVAEDRRRSTSGPDRTKPERTKPERTRPERTRPDRPSPDRPSPERSTPDRTGAQRSTGTRQPGDPSRAQVRRVIAGTARAHGVDPQLALAVSWQEAGWQMHHVSSADAIGAMQVIPSTGEWMSGVVGRDLRLHDLRDNVTAGVVLLRVLLDQTSERKAVAGYYQGLQGVRRFGMYEDTKHYVANVLALKSRFEQGRYPA